eukprot:TRINITY_DN4880_c0_g3_i3.p3 TRINITY_DN4880_c0_g3~~TRINITY_DN4880_c0_g3_i3.p3  ORF type:complete len:393 (-),score=131.04 TRINITY_DN4880_c0_g3_i3:4970-6148(-)
MTGNTIFSVTFPTPLSSVCMDACEYTLFCGSGAKDGQIFQVDLNGTTSSLGSMGMAASGNGSAGKDSSSSLSSSSTSTSSSSGGGLFVQRSSLEKLNPEYNGDQVLKGHKNQVTGLCMSADDKNLVSSSLDGSVKVWDPTSKQSIRSFYHKAGVTGAIVTRKPPKVLEGKQKFQQSIRQMKKFALDLSSAPFLGTSVAPSDGNGMASESASKKSGGRTGGMSTSLFSYSVPINLDEMAGMEGWEKEDTLSAFQEILRESKGHEESQKQLMDTFEQEGEGIDDTESQDLDDGDTERDMARELAALKKKVAKLEKENTRWQQVNDELYRYTMEHVMENESEEEEQDASNCSTWGSLKERRIGSEGMTVIGQGICQPSQGCRSFQPLPKTGAAGD